MKHFLQGTLLVAFGLVIGVACAEVAVRVFAPYSRDHVVPPGMFAIDTALGWRLDPGYTGTHHTRYFDVVYSINSLGFRDRERTPSLSDSTRRLLLFGDSHIFGWGVPLGQRFSDVAEASERQLDIWNMAVPGYGLDQEVVAYAKRSADIPANGAVFFVSKATLSRMLYGTLYRKTKPRFAVDAAGHAALIPPKAGSTVITDGLYRMLSPLYLPYFIEAQLGRLTRAAERGEATRSDVPVDSATMLLAKAALLYAAETAKKRGHEIFIIASLPDESAQDLQQFAQANGMTFMSTGWAAPPVALMFGKTDHHWIPELHGELGRRFAPILSRQPVSTM